MSVPNCWVLVVGMSKFITLELREKGRRFKASIAFRKSVVSDLQLGFEGGIASCPAGAVVVGLEDANCDLVRAILRNLRVWSCRTLYPTAKLVLPPMAKLENPTCTTMLWIQVKLSNHSNEREREREMTSIVSLVWFMVLLYHQVSLILYIIPKRTHKNTGTLRNIAPCKGEHLEQVRTRQPAPNLPQG